MTSSWGGYESVIWACDINPDFDEKTNSYGLKAMQVRLSVGLEPIDLQLEAYEKALKAI
jgi:cystathionine beta-lyase/cystathionine gamma-synthase